MTNHLQSYWIDSELLHKQRVIFNAFSHLYSRAPLSVALCYQIPFACGEMSKKHLVEGSDRLK